MNIINSNNNGPSLYTPQPSSGSGENPLSRAFAELQSGKPVIRSTYMTLAKYLGFLGVHFFAVRRWGRGFFQCLLTVIGCIAISGIVITTAIEPEYQEEILCVCFMFSLCLPASILIALACFCYWFFHTDEEFRKTFHTTNTKGN